MSVMASDRASRTRLATAGACEAVIAVLQVDYEHSSFKLYIIGFDVLSQIGPYGK